MFSIYIVFSFIVSAQFGSGYVVLFNLARLEFAPSALKVAQNVQKLAQSASKLAQNYIKSAQKPDHNKHL